MNLLFVDQFAHFGGAQRVLWETLKFLNRSGCQYSVAISGSGPFRDALTIEGIPVLDLPLGDYKSGKKTITDVLRFGFKTPLCVYRLVSYGRRERVDLLYANGPRTFVSTALAGLMLKKPVIWHLHNVLTSNSEIRALLYFSRWVSRVLICSRAVGVPLLARKAELQARIRVVYNPAPDWSREGSETEVTVCASGHSTGDMGLRFGMAGRITPLKGQMCFLRSARIVLDQAPQTSFLIIGSPLHNDPTDAAYYSELQKFVKEKRIQDSVRLVPYQDNVRSILEFLDVVVVSSLCPEASPRVLIEAMSLGRPVIAPEGGGVPEMIDDHKTGLLFEPGNHEQLAGKMLQLIRLPDWRRELGIKGKERALHQFSRTRFQEAIQTELTECNR